MFQVQNGWLLVSGSLINPCFTLQNSHHFCFSLRCCVPLFDLRIWTLWPSLCNLCHDRISTPQKDPLFGREMGPPAISGKSRLVKYYKLARLFKYYIGFRFRVFWGVVSPRMNVKWSFDYFWMLLLVVNPLGLWDGWLWLKKLSQHPFRM